MIGDNKFLKKLEEYISQQRIDHTKRVVSVALKLCNTYSGDSECILKAASLHDIAKRQTPELLKEKGVQIPDELDNCWESYPSVWHAFAGPYLINHLFEFQNDQIDDAVKYHTTGHANMDLTSKIVFVADFIEPGRKVGCRDVIEKIAFSDIDKAVALIAAFNLNKLTQKAKSIHPFSIACWNSYCQYITEDDTTIIK